MNIDALLNPGDGDSASSQPQRAPISHRHSYHGPSPSFPPSPNYWYNQGYHDKSDAQSTNQNYPGHYPQQQQVFVSYSHNNQPRGSTSTNNSMPPSPDPYQSRERFSSVSSGSSTNGDRRRAPRPKYEEEEMYFIWYHRVDLGQEWKDVREAFNRQFTNRQRSGFQGIQCKFYRFIKEKKCPTLREQRRLRDGLFLREGASAALVDDANGAPRYGVREYTKVWYPWMRKGDSDSVLPRR